jgi:hypothetical protein
VAANRQSGKTADTVILEVLVYEFGFDGRAEAEGKIKRRLRSHGRGPYEQARVDLLRRLKDDVQAEIHRRERSRYFTGRHGTNAAIEDFDVERLTQALARSYPDVPREEIAAFVPTTIYLYYLR